MRLIQNQHRIRRHIRVDQTLSLKHTVRHVLDPRLGARTVLEPDRIPDFLTESASDLLSDTFRDGHSCYTTRLSAPNLAMVGKSFLSEVLGHLRRFAGASVTDDDEDLML